MTDRNEPAAAEASTWTTETVCARCGTVFRCGAGSPSCWCDAVVLEPEQRARLAELRLEGCLCPECLHAL